MAERRYAHAVHCALLVRRRHLKTVAGRREKWALAFRPAALRYATTNGRAEAFNRTLKASLRFKQVKRFDQSLDLIVDSLKISYIRLAQERRKKLPARMPASKLARRTNPNVAAEATAAFMARAIEAATHPVPVPGRPLLPSSVIQVRRNTQLTRMGG